MVLSFANEKGSKLDLKKLWSIIIIAVILLALAIGTWAAYSAGYIGVNRNAKILRSMVREFSRTISGTGAKVVETKSVYGKLNGNGNGINYFGAALVRIDSVKDIDLLIAKLDEQFEYVDYCVPDESEIRSECLEHRKLSYDTVIDGSDEYISVFFYVSHHPDSDLCDLAGH